MSATLYIVVFFMCVISMLVAYFQFSLSSAESDAQKRLAEVQTKADERLKEAKTSLEGEKIKQEAEIEARKIKEESARKTAQEALTAREAKIKAAEAAVQKKLKTATASVKAANALKNKAAAAKRDADKKKKQADAAMAKAIKSGKDVDKKLAAEKKKLAAAANKKVKAANAAANKAKAQARAEAKKALAYKKKLGAAQSKLAAIPVIVDVRNEFRTSWVRPYGANAAVMLTHNKGRLDSPKAWSADVASNNRWYQIDNGKIGEIAGVAIKGRKDADQWVKVFKVKYKTTGNWMDVDGGARFSGNANRDTLVEVKFNKPVRARYIRMYPQEWVVYPSMRTGLITNDHNDGSQYKLLNIPSGRRSASSWWDGTWHPENGSLNAAKGWHPVNGAPSDGSSWYELQMNNSTKVAGVALQGRGTGESWQWITSFTAKYKDASDNWKDVDNGFVHSGTSDYHSIVWVPFNTPVNTKAVRIYPKTWNGWYSGRFDLLGFK